MDSNLIINVDLYWVNSSFFKCLFAIADQMIFNRLYEDEFRSDYKFKNDWINIKVVCHVGWFESCIWLLGKYTHSVEENEHDESFTISDFTEEMILDSIRKFEEHREDYLRSINGDLLKFPFYQFINIKLLHNTDIESQYIVWQGFRIEFMRVYKTASSESANYQEGSTRLLSGNLFLNNEFMMSVRVNYPNRVRRRRDRFYRAILEIYRDLFNASIDEKTTNSSIDGKTTISSPYLSNSINPFMDNIEDCFRILRSGMNSTCKSARK